MRKVDPPITPREAIQDVEGPWVYPRGAYEQQGIAKACQAAAEQEEPKKKQPSPSDEENHHYIAVYRGLDRYCYARDRWGMGAVVARGKTRKEVIEELKKDGWLDIPPEKE